MKSTSSTDYQIDFSTKSSTSKQTISKPRFRDKPLEVRCKKYKELMNKPENKNRLPIICELHQMSTLGVRSDLKFLTHEKMILKNFQGSIRKKLNFKDDVVLFFYQGKTVLKNDQTLGDLYSKFKADDGFLYLQFSEINALG